MQLKMSSQTVERAAKSAPFGSREDHLTTRYIFLFVSQLALLGCASQAERSARSTIETEANSSAHEATRDKETAPAKRDTRENQTLAGYLEYTALNNPGLEAAYYEWKAAVEKIPQSRSLPDPKFTYTYYIRQVETRVGPQRHAFSLSQRIPWYKKLSLKGDAAAEAAEAHHQRYEAKKLDLFFKVKKTYFEYCYLARAIAITEDNIKLIASLESVAQAKFTTASAPYSSVIKAQVELGKLEDKLRSLRQFRAPIMAALNAAMGRTQETILAWPVAIEDADITLDDDQLYEWLSRHNPKLRMLDQETIRAQTITTLKKHEWAPDFDLGVKLIETGDAAMPNVDDSGKNAVMVSLGLNIPLWSRKYSSAQDEASARLMAAEKRGEDARNRLGADLSVALFHYRDAERKIDLYRDTLLPKAAQSLASFQTAYAGEKADFLDLIDATRTLLEFHLSYERARADRMQRLSEIEMIVGMEIPIADSASATPDANTDQNDNAHRMPKTE